MPASLHRNAIAAADKLASVGTLTLTAITEAGSTLPNSALHCLVSAGNRWGNAPVGADPGAITPILNQAVRAAWAQVPGAEWYDIFISTAANALWVGRVTEAQRAAGGFIISAVGVTSAGGGAPPGGVDLGIVGTGLASNVNPFLVNNAYTPAVPTAIQTSGFTKAKFFVKMSVTDLRSLPSLVLAIFLQNFASQGDWSLATTQTVNLLTAVDQPLEAEFEISIDLTQALVALVDSIAGQGAAVSIWVELS